MAFLLAQPIVTLAKEKNTIYVGETSQTRMYFDCKMTGERCYFDNIQKSTRTFFLTLHPIGENAGPMDFYTSTEIKCSNQTYKDSGENAFKKAPAGSLNEIMVKKACNL